MSDKTPLVTPEGKDRLQAELDQLWRVERPETTQKVSWAASLGDRSENADYQYNKKRLREIDRRVRYIRKRLEQLKVVHYHPQQEGKVFFGAWAKIERIETDDAPSEVLHFRIAGYDEIFDREDYVSVDAPMAQALLGKVVDDEVKVEAPGGAQWWRILEIVYNK